MILAAALLAAPLVLQATSDAERVAGWTGDLDHWLVALEREHVLLRDEGVPAAVFERADWLRERIPDFSDQRVLIELQRCAALVGDGHTLVRPFGPRFETTGLPLHFYSFADGLFVVDAEPGHERWIGARLLELAGMDAERLLESVAPYVSRDNAQGVRWIGPMFLRLSGVHEALGAESGAPLRLAFEVPSGERIEASFAPSPLRMETFVRKLGAARVPGAPPAPLWLADVAREHWLRVLDDRTVYVQFNQVRDAPDERLADFAARLERTLGEAGARRLVIDVRHNNGGDSTLLAPLVAVLERFERSGPGAELVVLMGRNTFSAAQNFLSMVDVRTDAAFAGEPSSSRPNHIGDDNEVVLPWCGAIAGIANRRHEGIPGDTREWIEPDIAVELSSADYFASRDVLLERILAER